MAAIEFMVEETIVRRVRLEADEKTILDLTSPENDFCEIYEQLEGMIDQWQDLTYEVRERDISAIVPPIGGGDSND